MTRRDRQIGIEAAVMQDINTAILTQLDRLDALMKVGRQQAAKLRKMLQADARPKRPAKLAAARKGQAKR